MVILHDNPNAVPLNHQVAESEEEDEDESSSVYHTDEEDENELDYRNRVHFLLNSIGFNYLNNLHLNLNNWNNLNLNLPNLPHINFRNTTLWKFYEHGIENFSKIQTGFMTNLGKPDAFNLDISDSLNLSDCYDFQDIFISTRKGIKDPIEKFRYDGFTSPPVPDPGVYGDQNVVLGSDDDEESKTEDEPVALSEEFWSSILNVTTEGCPDSGVNLCIPGSQITVKAPINPFYHRTGFSLFQKLKVGVGSLLVPIRVVGILICLVTAWFLSWMSTVFMTPMDLRERPLSGWRKYIKLFIANVIMRILFFFVGFYWVKKRGKQATRIEAPILVVAPHSSFFDAFPLILMGAPSIVAKSSVANVPFFGQLVNMTQAVYVTRESKTSRMASLNLIKERAQSKEDWAQIYIYPEGTCTNRSSLLSFKLGAFHAGVPVQPVIIKYPNAYDSITWTFDGLTWYQALHRTLAQFVLYCEIEFLPVYAPNADEIKDPTLFANNVRQEMANVMGVPVTDYTYEEGTALSELTMSCLPSKLKQISELRNALKLSSLTELNVLRVLSSSGRNLWWVTYDKFVDTLHLGSSNAKQVEELYNIFKSKSEENESMVDIREYFVFSCLLNHNIRVDTIVPVIFLMYAEGQRKMSLERFVWLMERIFEMSKTSATEFFEAGNADENSSDKPIDLDKFSKKVKKRLEHLRLCALEASNLLHVYPPREREILSCKDHSSKSKSE